jgi:hypothetical protein
MKKATGKSNLSIVRDYLSGERPFVQVGYDENVALRSRKEGEEWEDNNGVKWVKKNGYKHRVSKKAQFILEPRCTICNADMKWGNYLDEKTYPKTQRCYECNIEFEGTLRQKGYFQDYEKYKTVNNELTQLIDFKQKITESIEYLEKYYASSKTLQFFNEDGSKETWLDDTDRREIVLADLKKDLDRINNLITLANTELEHNKYDKSVEKNIKDIVIRKIKDKENNV